MTQMLLGHRCKLCVVAAQINVYYFLQLLLSLQLLGGCYINPCQDVMPHLSLKVVGSVAMSLDMHPQSLKSSYSK